MCEAKGAFQIIRDVSDVLSDEKNWKATLVLIRMCRHTSLRSENQTTSIPLKRLNFKNFSICTTPIYFIIIRSQKRIRLTIIIISNKNNRAFYLHNKQRLLLECVICFSLSIYKKLNSLNWTFPQRRPRMNVKVHYLSWCLLKCCHHFQDWWSFPSSQVVNFTTWNVKAKS